MQVCSTPKDFPCFSRLILRHRQHMPDTVRNQLIRAHQERLASEEEFRRQILVEKAESAILAIMMSYRNAVRQLHSQRVRDAMNEDQANSQQMMDTFSAINTGSKRPGESGSRKKDRVRGGSRTGKGPKQAEYCAPPPGQDSLHAVVMCVAGCLSTLCNLYLLLHFHDRIAAGSPTSWLWVRRHPRGLQVGSTGARQTVIFVLDANGSTLLWSRPKHQSGNVSHVVAGLCPCVRDLTQAMKNKQLQNQQAELRQLRRLVEEQAEDLRINGKRQRAIATLQMEIRQAREDLTVKVHDLGLAQRNNGKLQDQVRELNHKLAQLQDSLARQGRRLTESEQLIDERDKRLQAALSLQRRSDTLLAERDRAISRLQAELEHDDSRLMRAPDAVAVSALEARLSKLQGAVAATQDLLFEARVTHKVQSTVQEALRDVGERHLCKVRSRTLVLPQSWRP